MYCAYRWVSPNTLCFSLVLRVELQSKLTIWWYHFLVCKMINTEEGMYAGRGRLPCERKGLCLTTLAYSHKC